MILALLLLMQVPLAMVSGLISEREARQAEVLAEFQRGWGPDQQIAGPVLLVPYSRPLAASGTERVTAWARLPAARLNVAATLRPEERRRGLFHAIVYTASVDLAGTITVPATLIAEAPGLAVDWRGARVVIGATDLRGMPADATMEWNNGTVALQASADCGWGALEAPAGLLEAPAPGTSLSFKAALTLRGTQSFQVVPLARQVEMRVASSWPTLSFTGNNLPLDYDIRANGSDAHWQLAAGAAASGWRSAGGCEAAAQILALDREDEVGLTLQEAVPTYLMVSRAAKYGVYFLTLGFLTLFLFEALSRVRIHLVQYGMVGLSLSLFALLLISIAEPLGFTAAYAISAAAVMAQASLYTLAVLGRRRLAAVFACVLGALFGFLYVVLSLDAYSLLTGTLGLFAALSVVMAATSRVNWSAASVSP
jgi:inner membrane protein